MENIIRLPRDPHRESQLLLPWYAMGRLDASDHAMVEAHLGACAECQADLKLERGLEAEVSGLPADVDEAWAAMLSRLRPVRIRRPAALAALLARLAAATGGWWRQGAPWLGWASAAALAAVLILGSLAPRMERASPYRTLASAPSKPTGNVVVIFRPETTEAVMRQALKAAHARLVDGPTAADAYVLSVPSAERAAALEMLRARKMVVLAEPIDAGESP